MNMTSIITRVAILVGFGGVVSIAMINRVDHAQPKKAVTTMPVAPMRVVATPKIVELPTISVRATTKELADAMNADVINGDADIGIALAHPVQTGNHLQTPRTVTPTLPSLGMDMPYYSFGKALQRVGKE